MGRPPNNLNSRSLDAAKLDAMVEPLTVRVERVKGASRQPIPLPQPPGPDGGEEGQTATVVTDWTKDEVRKIEQWLLTEWSGGGLYEITVSDSGTPPTTMKWFPSWETKQYPERVPPPLVDAQSQSAIIEASQPQIQRAPMSSAFPNGLPQGIGHVQTGYYPQPDYNRMPTQPQVGTPAWGAWQAEADRRKMDDELRALREQSAQREREAIEARHKAEVERMRIEADTKAAAAQRLMEQKFAEMQTVINNLTTQLSAKPQISPEIELLKEQARQAAAERDRERADAVARDRDRELRDLIKAMADEANRRTEALQRMFDQQMQNVLAQITAASNKPDAIRDVMMLVKEQSRENADAVKEVARQNRETITSLQGFMLNPLQMLQIAKETQSGAEQATERVTNFFGKVVDMQQRVTENALQMQPGATSVIDVVRDGMASVKEFAERYVGAKSQSEKFAMQTQAQVAEAQARAIEAQARAATPQPVVHTPPPPREERQLAGPKMPPVKRTNKSKADASDQPEPKRLGRTDVEWFTPALMDKIDELRAGVDEFLTSCSAKPPRTDEKGNLVGIHPDESALAIMEAVQFISQHQIVIPAMMELLFQERYADFIDVLLPNATQQYRDDVAQHLIDQLRELSGEEPKPRPAVNAAVPVAADASASGNEDDDGGVDDSEDDGDEDPDQDGKPTSIKIVPKPAKAPNGRPLRA